MTTFLNADLDISSREDLAGMAAVLQSRLIGLHVGRIRRTYFARFELRTQPRTADLALRGLLAAVESLPARHRAAWQRATTRDFNIGIQAGAEPHHWGFALAPATVMRVGRTGGRIVTTVYGAAAAGSRAE